MYSGGDMNATFVEDPDTFGRTLQCTSVSFWPTASEPAAALHTVAYSCITDVLIRGSSCCLQKAARRAALWKLDTGMLACVPRQHMLCFLANAVRVISFAVLAAHVRGHTAALLSNTSGSVLRQHMPCFLANALQVISFAVLVAHVCNQHCSPYEQHFSTSGTITTVTAACGVGCCAGREQHSVAGASTLLCNPRRRPCIFHNQSVVQSREHHWGTVSVPVQSHG